MLQSRKTWTWGALIFTIKRKEDAAKKVAVSAYMDCRTDHAASKGRSGLGSCQDSLDEQGGKFKTTTTSIQLDA